MAPPLRGMQSWYIALARAAGAPRETELQHYMGARSPEQSPRDALLGALALATPHRAEAILLPPGVLPSSATHSVLTELGRREKGGRQLRCPSPCFNRKSLVVV